MGNPFQIYGPFEISKTKVAESEYQKTFWTECDAAYPRLSEAKGLYVISLRNGRNHSPQYVGITRRDFTKEVFNANNLVKILNVFAKEKGALCVHLLAKPNNSNTGFYSVTSKVLLWTEMFVLMMCRKKNPEIANIMGKPSLENAAIENITDTSKGKGANIKTFRNVLGLDNFGATKGKIGRSKPKSSLSAELPAQLKTPTPVPPRIP